MKKLSFLLFALLLFVGAGNVFAWDSIDYVIATPGNNPQPKTDYFTGFGDICGIGAEVDITGYGDGDTGGWAFITCFSADDGGGAYAEKWYTGSDIPPTVNFYPIDYPSNVHYGLYAHVNGTSAVVVSSVGIYWVG